MFLPQQMLKSARSILINMVLNGVLDLAFVFEPPTTSELIARQLEKIPLVLVSSIKGATLEELFKESYLLVDWGRSFSITHAAFVEDRCLPRVHCSSGGMALDLMLSQGGSCYLAKQMVEPYLADEKLFLIPDAPTIERFSYAVFRTENEYSGLTQDILSCL
jgi:DNA-binding transcriptional LysR family regulator